MDKTQTGKVLCQPRQAKSFLVDNLLLFKEHNDIIQKVSEKTYKKERTINENNKFNHRRF